MNSWRSISRIVVALLLAVLVSSSVYAKDIKLGGEQKLGKLPPNVIVLPTIAVMIRDDDGGWKHIKIDAWLAGTDEDNAKKLDTLKNFIKDRADREFPNRNFEILQSARQGAVEAKRVIRAAVEAGLGGEWKGEVLIKNMLVY